MEFAEIEDELKGKEFWFPIEQVYFESGVVDLQANQKLEYGMYEQAYRTSVLPNIH